MAENRQKQRIRQIINRWFKFSHRVFGRSVPVISIIVTILSYIYISLLVITVYNLSKMAGSATDTLFMSTDKSFRLMFGIVFGTFFAIFSYLFIPGFFSFILALPISILWRSPVQILVLRKFHKGDASRSLKKAIRKYIAPIGHTYSLADENIEIPWYIRLPVVFTQLAFLHFRLRKIKTKRHINRLLAAVEVKFARNVNWMVSRSKIFPIHCSDNSWKSCVSKMMWKFDVILVDVSELSKNIIWEIKYAKDQGLLEKNLFLTTVEKRKESMVKKFRLALKSLWLKR
jgi:hypothetical protein